MATQIKQVLFSPEIMAQLLEIHQAIPEFDRALTASQVNIRRQDKPYLLLFAYDGEQIIGYKFGYMLSEKVFYSCLGGVLPAYRKHGVARDLLRYQETWALASGYQKIKVKSMNCYPAMLQMLIRYGYQIAGYEERGDPSLSKIVFEKWLL